jgi:hypothetical protein
MKFLSEEWKKQRLGAAFERIATHWNHHGTALTWIISSFSSLSMPDDSHSSKKL